MVEEVYDVSNTGYRGKDVPGVEWRSIEFPGNSLYVQYRRLIFGKRIPLAFV